MRVRISRPFAPLPWARERGFIKVFLDKHDWLAHKFGGAAERHFTQKREYYRQYYLKSEHWKALKAKKLAESPCCERCGRIGCEPHHRNYKNLYDVRTNDLETLCRECHVNEHIRLDAVKQQIIYHSVINDESADEAGNWIKLNALERQPNIANAQGRVI